MPDSSADRDPLDRLAEEFVARLRAGQRPALTEYADRHPELADQIKELFPALVEMEHLKPATGEHTGPFTPAAEPSDPVRVGEFRIVRRVGRGGMGVVYEAVQESLGRHVALKLLPAEAVADPKRRERFRREASAAARLHHTNIVPVFGVGEAEGRHFYAMQFISGHPLDAVIDEVKRLKEKSAVLPASPRAVSEVAVALLTGAFATASRERQRPEAEPDGLPVADVPGTLGTPAAGIPGARGTPVGDAPGAPPASSPPLSGSISEGGRGYWATVARIGVQAADALAYAHGQGILHRDIKPANLLLDLRGTVWVADFGLAKSADAAGADDLTRAGDIVGTVRYMAPERFEGAGDHRADVYALGLTLYELLTLTPAFTARGRAQLVEQVVAAAPPAPRSLVPAIPRDLETIVLKAIARDPAMRYGSAGELAEDLRRFLEDRPIRARRASSAEQAFRWCRRNPAVASLLAAVLVVFAVGAAVAGFFAVRAENQRQRAETREQEADDQRKHAQTREQDANDARKRADAEAEKVRAKELYTRRLLYASQMNRASVALNEGRIARVRELLGETTPQPDELDLRGWEWHYLDRLLRGEYRTVTLEGKDANARYPWNQDGASGRLHAGSSSLSANGRRLVGLRTDGEGFRFDVWDPTTGRLVNQLPPTGQPALVTHPVMNPGPGPDRSPQPGERRTPFAIFSHDGSQLGSWEQTDLWQKDDPTAPANSAGRLRIWNVGTGQELTAPDIGLSLWDLSRNHSPSAVQPLISIDSGGVRWLESSSPPPTRGWPDRGPPKEPKKVVEKAEPVRPPECIARYWDRTSGQVTTQRFRPGDGTDTTSVHLIGKSQDGRILLFRLDRPKPSNRPRESIDRVTLPLECWDVVATPPRRVWSASPPALPFWDGTTHISPGGKMVAVRDDAGVTVYRTEGRAGEPVVEWRSEIPVQNKNPQEDRWAVFDDGQLVFGRPEGVALLSPDRDLHLSHNYNTVATRQTVLYTGGNGRGTVHLTDDGKTLVGLGIRDVWVWNLDRVPAPRTSPRAPVLAKSPDGRLKVEQIRIEQPADSWPTERPETVGGDLLIKDAATDEVRHRIAVPQGRAVRVALRFVAGSLRLLVEFHLPGTPGTSALTWELYDTDKWCRLAREEWNQPDAHDGRSIYHHLVLSPDRRWFIQGSLGDADLIVRDALTGRVAYEMHAPEGAVVGALEFDPTANRLAVITVPARMTVRPPTPQPIPAGPFDIRLIDLSTGTALRTQLAAGECADTREGGAFAGRDPLLYLFFSPSGRLLVGFRDAARTFRVWVGRAATGEFERTLTAAAPESESAGGWSSGAVRRLALDRAGRRVAVVGGDTVRVWDLEDGRLVATLRGHDSPVSAVALSPDGTRLFTLDVATRLDKRVGVRVGVWDLETARLVFTLQPPEAVLLSRMERVDSGTMPTPGEIEFRDGQLKVRRHPADFTFDGTPVKP